MPALRPGEHHDPAAAAARRERAARVGAAPRAGEGRHAERAEELRSVTASTEPDPVDGRVQGEVQVANTTVRPSTGRHCAAVNARGRGRPAASRTAAATTGVRPPRPPGR